MRDLFFFFLSYVLEKNSVLVRAQGKEIGLFFSRIGSAIDLSDLGHSLSFLSFLFIISSLGLVQHLLQGIFVELDSLSSVECQNLRWNVV